MVRDQFLYTFTVQGKLKVSTHTFSQDFILYFKHGLQMCHRKHKMGLSKWWKSWIVQKLPIIPSNNKILKILKQKPVL